MILHLCTETQEKPSLRKTAFSKTHLSPVHNTPATAKAQPLLDNFYHFTGNSTCMYEFARLRPKSFPQSDSNHSVFAMLVLINHSLSPPHIRKQDFCISHLANLWKKLTKYFLVEDRLSRMRGMVVRRWPTTCET